MKNIKSRKKTLWKLLYEQPELGTVQTVSPKETEQPLNYSLDQKVDRFLVQYERESIPSSATNAGIPQSKLPSTAGMGPQANMKPPSLHEIIFSEQDEDEPPADDTTDSAAPSLDTGDDSSGGGGVSEPQIPVPKLNINLFANKVSRLVDNFEALIDPKLILLNRIYVYLLKNYNEQVAKELMIILETEYGLTNRSETQSVDDTVGEIPLSVGAVGGGAGGEG